jgi:predicted transcriptional regulator YdeE
MASIPDQIYSGVHYGITHDESIYDTAKYMIAVEVSSLDNLPPGYVGRRFEPCEYAAFNCSLDDVTSGKFWNYFNTVFLKEQGLSQPDVVTTKRGNVHSRYPKFEVYENCPPAIQIYAPILKNQ